MVFVIFFVKQRVPATGPRARKLGSGLMMYDADVDRQNKVAGTNRVASGLVSESEMGRVRCGELGPKVVVGGGCRAERVQVGRCGLLYVAGSTYTYTCASKYTHGGVRRSSQAKQFAVSRAKIRGRSGHGEDGRLVPYICPSESLFLYCAFAPDRVENAWLALGAVGIV